MMVDLINNTDAQLSVGDWLQAVGIFPVLAFFVDYVVVRPFRRSANGIRLVPWFKSAIGIMFAALTAALFLNQLVVVLSLTFGSDYPFRWLVRDVGFGGIVLATGYMYVVYLLESRAPDSVLTPHDVKDNSDG